jgi:hypothetical protein
MGLAQKILFAFSMRKRPKSFSSTENIEPDLPVQRLMETCWIVAAAAAIEYNYPGRLKTLITKVKADVYKVRLRSKTYVVQVPEYVVCGCRLFSTTQQGEHWMAVLEAAHAKALSDNILTNIGQEDLEVINGGLTHDSFQILLLPLDIPCRWIHYRPFKNYTTEENVKWLEEQMVQENHVWRAWMGAFSIGKKSKINSFVQRFFHKMVDEHAYAILRVWWDDDHCKSRFSHDKQNKNLPKPLGFVFLCYNPWGYIVPKIAKTKGLPPGHFILTCKQLVEIAEDIDLYPVV